MSESDYYHTHALQYHEKTFHLDSGGFLSDFIAHLPPGASILDIGCGSGRDLIYLKKQGFVVTGFERSPKLSHLAQTCSKCPVILGDFQIFDFSHVTYDALLMSGSLVHIPHARLPMILNRILKALKVNGIVYISVKQGHGTTIDSANRQFYLWQENAFTEMLDSVGCQVLSMSLSESAVGTGEVWLGFVAVKIA